MESMAHVRARPRKTKADYMALPDVARAELLDGELYMTPSPGVPHQCVVGNLYAALRAHVRAKALGRVFVAPLDVHLSTGDIAQPDVCFVAKHSPCRLERWIYGAPELVVEVLSPIHPERDLVVKRARYARGGVAEYWIVDPAQKGIEVLALQRDAYKPLGWFTGDARLPSPALPEIALTPDATFEG